MPGILNARVAREKFRFSTAEPSDTLAPYLAHYWSVTWDLRGTTAHQQQVLPYPSVNMTFKAGRCRVAGVLTGRFFETLEGAGRVIGVRFQPAGFRPFLGAPLVTITNRYLPVDEVFGVDGRRLADAVVAAEEPAATALLDGFLARRVPDRPDPATDLVAAVVARAAADQAITRVARLAREFALDVRQLQRLFAEHVGVGPKWVIRRYRLHDAAARAAEGAGLDLAGLAAELGYTDQAHLTRDFTATIGVSPARYARGQ